VAQKRLKAQLRAKKDFIIVAELTGGPGYSFAPIEKFLTGYQQAGAGVIPSGFDFTGIMLPQNPGGVANIDPSDVLAVLTQKNLLGDLDFIPHLSCKDSNADGLTSTLVGYRHRGVETLLALTGDKPVKAKGVFEVESVGLLSQIHKMNNSALIKSTPEQLAQTRLIFAGAAVSPFKYTEASLMQQYYKMEKKIAAGAEFLVTQVGWDWKKSMELMQYLRDNRIEVPVLGNVYWLTTLTPAPRLMHDIKLPGCFVSDALLAKLQSETVDEHIERAAQQVAMYRSIGAAGADIGGVHDFDIFVKILRRLPKSATSGGSIRIICTGRRRRRFICMMTAAGQWSYPGQRSVSMRNSLISCIGRFWTPSTAASGHFANACTGCGPTRKKAVHTRRLML
jgi:methylenetetrahydrofolate reductase (NADPH)